MGLEVNQLGHDTLEHGRKIGDATLNGIPGTGTLQVVRNAGGALIDVAGTWHTDAETDTSSLEQAMENGQPLRYEGKLYDPLSKDDDHIITEVKLTSSNTYRRNELPDEEASSSTFFNFKPTSEIVAS